MQASRLEYYIIRHAGESNYTDRKPHAGTLIFRGERRDLVYNVSLGANETQDLTAGFSGLFSLCVLCKNAPLSMLEAVLSFLGVCDNINTAKIRFASSIENYVFLETQMENRFLGNDVI